MRLLVWSFVLFCLGCSGFHITGTMCESMQPGELMSECRAYDDEAAAKASLPEEDPSGECLECEPAEKIEIRR